MGVLGWVSVVLLVHPTDACLSRCAEPIKGGLPHEEVSLIVVAPAINEAFRTELAALGGEVGEIEPGVFCLAGFRFATYMVETDVMAARGEAVLSLVSRVFLRQRQGIMEQLIRTGHAALVWYMLQQVQQFHSLGEDFAMQHTESEYLGELEVDMLTSVLEAAPEDVLASVLTAAPEEMLARVLKTIPVEKRLRGLPPEELAAGLSDEQAARLWELLERKRGH